MLSVSQREHLRKLVKNFVVKNRKLKKSEIVNHFIKTGYARQTVYNTLNKLASGQPINDNKRTGRPISWAYSRNEQLKRLVNNRKGVSQRRLARKFSCAQSNISRQLAKMDINYYKREKRQNITKNKKLNRKRTVENSLIYCMKKNLKLL